MADNMCHPIPCASVTAEDVADEAAEIKTRAEASKRRIASLRSVAGIWADRTDIPADGLDYERALRNEWR